MTIVDEEEVGALLLPMGQGRGSDQHLPMNETVMILAHGTAMITTLILVDMPMVHRPDGAPPRTHRQGDLPLTRTLLNFQLR